MADFKTHIAASTLVGIGYGAAGYVCGAPLSTALVAGGLCSVSGMLPDLDSNSGTPVRETMALVAAVVPALMIPRFQQMQLGPEAMALAAAMIYVVIRFGVGEIFKRYTVHRGMWHSLPAMAVAGLLAFLLVSGDQLEMRLFKSCGVMLGFLVHLVLDELWSLQVRRGRLKIKRSFGTALKFWTTKSLWANVSTYGKLMVLIALVIGDPYLMQQLGAPQHNLPHSPEEWFQQLVDRSSSLFVGQVPSESTATATSAEPKAQPDADSGAAHEADQPPAETAERLIYEAARKYVK